MKVLIAIDSLKGSLSSLEAAHAIQEGIHNADPNTNVCIRPLADGGEGTARALTQGTHGHMETVTVTGPLGDPVKADYGIIGDTAVIEMAAAAGITLVPASRRNPLYTTTYGVGELILDAMEKNCRHFIIGIGGSATNDAGIGMLKALGARFLDSGNGELEPVGENLIKVHQIDISQLNPALKESHFTIACDVSNPFFGEEGAAYVYAPQKGANSLQVIELDNGLRHYAQVIKEYTNMDISQLPGAGAAGGMGGGLLPFLNAELQSGIEVILKTLRFEEVVRQADLILTGEGKLDRQTGMGKALDGILRVGEKCQVPVIAFGGAVEATEALNRMGFTAVLPIQPFPVTLEEAMRPEFTKENIERTVRQVVRIIKQFTK